VTPAALAYDREVTGFERNATFLYNVKEQRGGSAKYIYLAFGL